MGLVKSAAKHSAQGVLPEEQEVHGCSQQEKDQQHEERGHLLRRTPKRLSSISAALFCADHCIEDLY